MWTQDTEQRQSGIVNPETWTTCGHKTQSKDNQGLSIQRHGQHVITMQSCLYNNYSTIAYLFISVIFEFWHMLTISERRRVSISDTGTGIAYLRGQSRDTDIMWTQDTEQRQSGIVNPETRTTCGHKTQSIDKN
jgi:Zn ribbon nucleic-acid-binding protein